LGINSQRDTHIKPVLPNNSSLVSYSKTSKDFRFTTRTLPFHPETQKHHRPYLGKALFFLAAINSAARFTFFHFEEKLIVGID
jgi:hypothetical protein